ncbi:extracellular solute-binding protein [Breznakiella homolactica]|uniref:Extracellular solute-binding protein n=1 Tax=Breznakiella homolactica TaxID=2798577 RepID=A0A7T7XPL9_9SPIR|nr:extracellular solute-binding protein [Breznakiella homolactica]QQO10063.1 extracellular solute-binding protein [Breznakiella homolactica]
MKKFIVLLAGIALLPGIIWAGGKKDMDNTVTLQLWHRYSGKLEAAVLQIISDFETQNPDIKIEVTSKPGEFIELLQNMIIDVAAGNPAPDLFMGGYSLLDYIHTEMDPTPVNELAPSLEQYAAFADKFIPPVLNLGAVKGDQIAVPFGLANNVLYYNEDIFRAAGLSGADVPRTWDDVIRVGGIIKERTGKYAITIWKGDLGSDMSLVYSNGGTLLSPDGTRVSFDTPETVEAIKLWQTINRLGLEPVSTPDEDMANFIAGEVAMYVELCSLLSSIRNSADFTLKVAEFPSFGTKQRALPAAGGTIISFTKDRAKYDAVWRFLDFITDPEAMVTSSSTGRLCSTKAQVPVIPGQEAAYAQLEYMVPGVSWPGGSKGLEINSLYLTKRTEIIRSSMDAEAALRQLTLTCNRLLSE